MPTVIPTANLGDTEEMEKMLSGQPVDREAFPLLRRMADPKSWDADSLAHLTQLVAHNLYSCLRGQAFEFSLLEASLSWLKTQALKAQERDKKGLEKVLHGLERRLEGIRQGKDLIL